MATSDHNPILENYNLIGVCFQPSTWRNLITLFGVDYSLAVQLKSEYHAMAAVLQSFSFIFPQVLKTTI